MDTLVIVAAIVGGVVSILQLYKWLPFKNNATQRPYLDMHFEYRGGSGRNLGMSPNAVLKKFGEIEVYEADESAYFFELNKKLVLIVVNNSELTAYYPRLIINPNSKFQPQLNKVNNLDPLTPHSTLSLEGTIGKIEERLPRHRTNIANFPDKELTDSIDLVIEYQGATRRIYYTRMQGDKLSYPKRLPKEFRTSPSTG